MTASLAIMLYCFTWPLYFDIIQISLEDDFKIEQVSSSNKLLLYFWQNIQDLVFPFLPQAVRHINSKIFAYLLIPCTTLLLSLFCLFFFLTSYPSHVYVWVLFLLLPLKKKLFHPHLNLKRLVSKYLTHLISLKLNGALLPNRY